MPVYRLESHTAHFVKVHFGSEILPGLKTREPCRCGAMKSTVL